MKTKEQANDAGWYWSEDFMEWRHEEAPYLTGYYLLEDIPNG